MIDPDVGRRSAIKGLLLKEYFAVTALSDTTDLARALISNPPDVVLLSYRAAKTEGFQQVGRIHGARATAHVPIVFLHDGQEPEIWADCALRKVDEAITYASPDWKIVSRLNQLIRVKEKLDAMCARQHAMTDFGFAEDDLSFPPSRPQALLLGLKDAGLSAQTSGELAQRLRDDFPLVKAAPDQTADVTVISEAALGWNSALRQIAKLHRDRPRDDAALSPAILAISTTDNPTAAQKMLELGADDVVVGSYTADEVALRLRRLGWARHFAKAIEAATTTNLQSAVRDPLTGLYNRRYASNYLAGLAKKRKSDSSVTVMMLDLDKFKGVNDRFGHAAGDAVLKEAADRICGVLRASDLVARIGGEEFLVVLSDTDTATAARIAERVRQAIAATPFGQSFGATIKLSISIGATHKALERGAATPDMMMQEADRALYVAKDQGRNQVSFANTTLH